ncbi:MAG: cupin domain-containing protein [Planctomycetes bacterium]|nr:cupin domain-containing protein [Planctomycetota bacterium]
MSNLFDNLSERLPEELVEILASGAGVRIERIVSTGQSSPPGFWYDQEQAEWVIVLKGNARLLFEGDDEPLVMKSGDYVLISAHRRHRVEGTSADEPTIWLAVFFDEMSAA